MFRSILAAAIVLIASAAHAAPPPAPTVDSLVQQHSYRFDYTATGLAGPGADFLKAETARAQFVLFGEAHDDQKTPELAGAIFAMLNREHGFQYLAVEQDPIAMERLSTAPLRGDLERIAALSKAYPTLFEFTADPDLKLLGDAGRISKAQNPIWGLEQALGPALYLEELVKLAPDAQVRATTAALLDEVRAKETARKNYAAFLHNDPTATARLRALRTAFEAKPGSRAARLLDGLVSSSEVFGYDRRATDEWVGLYNNTERELILKANFMRDYRKAAAGGATPRVMFKFGGWHMYRGRSPSGAYPISNFAHEFALSNDMNAFGIMVLPGQLTWDKLDPSLKMLLPPVKPAAATIIDLRPLRAVPKTYREKLELKDRVAASDLINAFDAIIILPDGPEAKWTLTGFESLGG